MSAFVWPIYFALNSSSRARDKVHVYQLPLVLTPAVVSLMAGRYLQFYLALRRSGESKRSSRSTLDRHANDLLRAYYRNNYSRPGSFSIILMDTLLAFGGL